jgi:hypothetical protein
MDNLTPTQAVVAAAQPPEVTLPNDGKPIVVRVLTPLEQFRYKKVIGKFTDNPGYMIDALMAASVRSIDGAPMPFPQNEAGIELIIEKLGWGGWQSVQQHFNKLGEEQAESVDNVKN